MGANLQVYIGGRPSPNFYSTNFDTDENPLSEGGRWQNGGSFYGTNNNIRALSGAAVATAFNSASGPYDDSIALLTPSRFNIGLNHRISGTVFRAGGYSPTANHECNLFVRGGQNGLFLRGYELNLSLTGQYGYIVLWKGLTNTLLSSFVQLTAITHPALNDGDVISFDAFGTVLTARLGATVLGTYDTVSDPIKYGDGTPGPDIWAEPGTTLASAGFTAISVVTL